MTLMIRSKGQWYPMVSRSCIAFMITWIMNVPVWSQPVNDGAATQRSERIEITAGTGAAAVMDRYISQQRYEGPMTAIAAAWSSVHDSIQTTVAVEFRHGAHIANHGLDAAVYNGGWEWSQSRPRTTILLFDRPVILSAGPFSGMMLHGRYQQVAYRDYFSKFLSYLLLFHGGVQADAKIPVLPSTSITAGMHLELLSIGVRTVDVTAKTDNAERPSAMKILTPFSQQHLRFLIGVEQSFDFGVGFALRYRFNVLRNTAWDELRDAEDLVQLTVGYAW